MSHPTSDPSPKKKAMRAKPNSPLSFMREHVVFDSEVDNVVRFWGQFMMPDFTGVEGNEEDYIIDSEYETLWKIAFVYYGDESLWWVIAARNTLDLPDAQLFQGRKIKVPSKRFVETQLLSQFKDTGEQNV